MTQSTTAVKAWLASAIALVSSLVSSLTTEAEIKPVTILTAVLAALIALSGVYYIPNQPKDPQPPNVNPQP